jgi:hypothetical protein
MVLVNDDSDNLGDRLIDRWTLSSLVRFRECFDEKCMPSDNYNPSSRVLEDLAVAELVKKFI